MLRWTFLEGGSAAWWTVACLRSAPPASDGIAHTQQFAPQLRKKGCRCLQIKTASRKFYEAVAPSVRPGCDAIARHREAAAALAWGCGVGADVSMGCLLAPTGGDFARCVGNAYRSCKAALSAAISALEVACETEARTTLDSPRACMSWGVKPMLLTATDTPCSSSRCCTCCAL